MRHGGSRFGVAASGAALRRLSRLVVFATALLAFGVFASAASAGQTRPQVETFGSAGELGGPSGIAIDPSSGEVYVGGYDTTEFKNHVFKFDPATGELDSSFGSNGQIDASSTAVGSFAYPHGIAVDPSSGDFYVADWYNHVVYKYDSSGNPVNSFGDSGLNDGALHGIDTAAGGFGPSAIAVNPTNGDIYIADGDNSVVDVYDSTGAYKSQFDTTATGMNGPSGIAMDSNHDLYLAGSGQVQKFDTSGNPVPVDGVSGDTNVLDSSGGNSVAVDPSSNDVYVDEGANITQYDSNGSVVAKFGVQKINASVGIAVSSGAGAIYATDSGDGLVHSFGSLEQSSTLGVNIQGSGSVTCDTGSGSGQCAPYYANGTTITLEATPSQHFSFGGWSGDCSGTSTCTISNLSADKSVTATFNQIQRNVTVSVLGTGTGSVSATAGPISNCASGGGGACSGLYNDGSTVVLKATHTGRTAFSGWGGACTVTNGPICEVQNLTAASTVTATFAPLAPNAVSYTFQSSIPTGSPGPYGADDVAVDQTTGNVFVANHDADSERNGGSVTELSPAGAVLNSWQKTSGLELVGVDYDSSSGLVYVDGETYDEGRGGIVNEIIPTDPNGNPEGFSITAPTAIRFAYYPYPIRVDENGHLFFPDNKETLTEISTTTGNVVKQITCSDCPGHGFLAVKGLAIAPDGSIYVADLGNPFSEPPIPARVIRLHPDGSFASVLTEFELGNSTTAFALAVDPKTGDVFVGTGRGPAFHITGFDGLGHQFTDFAEGDIYAYDGGDSANFNHFDVSGLTGAVYVADSTGPEGVVRVFTQDPLLAASTEISEGVGPSTATVTGIVNPAGVETTSCKFEYGPNPSYGESAPCAPGPTNASIRTAVAAELTGLNSTATYHYRVVETTSQGTATGEDETFTTTTPSAPGATTGAASGVTQAKAHLSGHVNPEGGDTTCKFEYGTSNTYGSSAPCATAPGSGVGEGPAEADLSGLTASTTYHFRISATNAGGTTHGTDATFTTLAETCATNPALCPPPPPPPPTCATNAALCPHEEQPKPLKCRKGFKKKKVHGKLKCVKATKPHKHHHKG